MVKNLNCHISLNNSDNLIIFKFRNYKFDLKDNFIKNEKTRMLPDFYTLKRYEARLLKKSLRGSNFVQKFGPY